MGCGASTETATVDVAVKRTDGRTIRATVKMTEDGPDLCGLMKKSEDTPAFNPVSHHPSGFVAHGEEESQETIKDSGETRSES
jgi:hypothetical protein